MVAWLVDMLVLGFRIRLQVPARATEKWFGLELLLDVMCGKYFSDLQELANDSHPGGLFQAVQSVENAENGSKSLELLKQLQLVTSQFDGHSKSAAPSAQVPLPSLLSTLANSGDAAEADADREQHWRTVQSERRFVSFGVPNAWSRDSLLACFRSGGKAFGFSGVLNTAHWLFCGSADLVHEEGTEPWVTPCPPSDAQWKDAIAFISSASSGPADFEPRLFLIQFIQGSIAVEFLFAT